jgi:hypothetical protein
MTAPTSEDVLLAALLRLDDMVERALVTAEARLGPPTPFRGLYVDRTEIDRLLRTPPLSSLSDGPAAPQPPALAALGRQLRLSSFDLDVVLVALGPELDLRYQRLYAYLQDDVTRRRPSVGLALDLICSSPAERVAARARFAGDAPLLAERVLVLGDEPGPLLERTIGLDEQIVRQLLGCGGLDERLMPTCRLLRPSRTFDELPVPKALRRDLEALVAAGERPLRLSLEGRPGLGQQDIAEGCACMLGAPLLVAEPGTDPLLAAREAALHGAVLYLEGGDTAGRALGDDVPIVLAGARAAPPGFLPVTLSLPEADVRAACWRRELEASGLRLEPEAIEALAARFRLGPERIREAVAAAEGRTRLRLATRFDGMAPAADVFAAARARCGVELEALARRVRPSVGWDDLILPDGAVHQLRELCNRVEQRGRVLDTWGFGRKLTRGKGVSALFAGASGTGKTLAAEVVASALELDLFVVDLAGVVSKYIGETEKNLASIFQAAEDASCVLFFDEADALFGKRSEVRDSHDRYANIEISYLLQRIELFEGISILATNLDRNLDDAFVRRLDLAVHFPFPAASERRRIWEGIWPAATPVSSAVDFAELAERFSLSGGSIKSAAVAAAYLAAADGGVVTEGHLLDAVRSEYEKAGRSVADDQPEEVPA